jgi:hypothetical protein
MRQRDHVRPMRRARRAVTALLGAVLAALLASSAAAADNGVDLSSSNRYVLDAKHSIVRAQTTLTLRNTTPNQVTSQGETYFYYDSYSLPVPAGAEDLRVESGGVQLGVSLTGTDDPGTSLARIAFPPLQYGQTRTIDVSYVIPGEPIRARDYTRVGPGYATFAADGFGDPGQVTVEVVVPAKMIFDATTGGFTHTQKGSKVTYTATQNNGPGAIWTLVSLRNPDKASTRTMKVAGTKLTLSAFPDDTKWLKFVRSQVRSGLPTLTKLVGAPWPGGLDQIREDASPTVRGYDGWFDSSENEIVISEDLHEDTLYHELAHAWFNPDTLKGRWLYEGLAESMADRTVRATGGDRVRFRTPSRSSAEAVPLSTWTQSYDNRSTDVDGYAYPASYAAVTAMLRRLDDDEVAAVVGGAVRGDSAYDLPGRHPRANHGRTDWRRFLDLVETRGKGKGAAKVMRTWVLTDAQSAKLPERRKARQRYAELDAADGGWAPPQGLRSAMTAWRFTAADRLTRQLGDLAGEAAKVQEAAGSSDLPVPEAVQTAYESADDKDAYAALATMLPRSVEVIGEVGTASDAVSGDRNPVAELGAVVLGIDGSAIDARAHLDAGDLDTAEALAHQTTGRAEHIFLVGLGLVALGTLLLVALALTVRWAVADAPGRR